jgi:hypothetical protein
MRTDFISDLIDRAEANPFPDPFLSIRNLLGMVRIYRK